MQEYRFTWLTREPIVLRYDVRRRLLTFKELFPDVARGSPLLADVRAVVERSQSPRVPAHRRLDRRRVNAGCMFRRGAVSVTLVIKGSHGAYAARKGVNLVHEIFTTLQASHPEYLWERFGLPAD